MNILATIVDWFVFYNEKDFFKKIILNYIKLTYKDT